jgi:SAM-dependent methyltransferase
MQTGKRHVERLEILSTSLLDEARTHVHRFRALEKELPAKIGWHYILDLSWTAQEMSPVAAGTRFLDAGAGRGLMQLWLSDEGGDVVSVDRSDRANTIDSSWRVRWPIEGLRGATDLAPTRFVPPAIRAFLPPRSPQAWSRYPSKFSDALRKMRARPAGQGTVYIYDRDLSDMSDVPSESIDAVVSISSLEHNDLDGLKACVAELMRVLKPGGVLTATVGAANDKDWFHEPSMGWCYTEETLREAFDLPDSAKSNYERHDELMDDLRNCDELKDNLADFYFKSGDNGMPWGKWDPLYQSVGVVKVKPRKD